MSKGRAEAFSDGVFAIVITLLILEIGVPEVAYDRLAESLVDLLPRVFAYVISFGVIGVYWFAHHQSFQMVSRLNGYLLWLNMVYLLTVSFMPFPTALLGRYPMQPIPIVIYGINLIAANLTGLLVTLYLRAHPELSSGYRHRLQHKTFGLYIFVNSSYLIAILLGFSAPIWSYVIYTVVLLVVIVYYTVGSVPPSPEEL